MQIETQTLSQQKLSSCLKKVPKGQSTHKRDKGEEFASLERNTPFLSSSRGPQRPPQ